MSRFCWLALALTACPPTDLTDTDTDTDTDADTDVTTVIQWPDPTLDVISPVADEVLVGPDVTVQFVISNFELTGPDPSSDPDAGAQMLPLSPRLPWSLWMLLPRALAHEPGDRPGGYAEVTLDGTVIGLTEQTFFTLTDVEPGTHFVVVELYWPDGDAFYPPVDQRVYFTVSDSEDTATTTDTLTERVDTDTDTDTDHVGTD